MISRLVIPLIPVALVLAACGTSTPSESSTPPSGSPAASASVGPVVEAPVYEPVALREGKLYLTLHAPDGRGWGVIAEGESATWRAAPIKQTLFRARSAVDANGTRGFLTPTGVLLLDPKGRLRTVETSTGGATGLAPLPDGGFVVTGVEKLVRIDPTAGTASESRLPAGYLLVGTTSDPDRMLVANAAKDLAIFGPADALAPLSFALDESAPAPAKRGLAFIRTPDGFSLIKADSSAAMVGDVPFEATASAIDPSGSYIALVTCDTTGGTCAVDVGKAGTEFATIGTTTEQAFAIAVGADGAVVVLTRTTDGVVSAVFFGTDGKKPKTIRIPSPEKLTPPSPKPGSPSPAATLPAASPTSSATPGG